MANGIIRCDKDHSNISTPSPKENNTIYNEKIKREKQGMNANVETRVTIRKNLNYLKFFLDKAKTICR